MNPTWIAASAAAEATAQQKQVDEELAHERFRKVRADIEAAGGSAQAIETPEFHSWITARHASDDAWGAWAMIMDAKPVV